MIYATLSIWITPVRIIQAAKPHPHISHECIRAKCKHKQYLVDILCSPAAGANLQPKQCDTILRLNSCSSITLCARCPEVFRHEARRWTTTTTMAMPFHIAMQCERQNKKIPSTEMIVFARRALELFARIPFRCCVAVANDWERFDRRTATFQFSLNILASYAFQYNAHTHTHTARRAAGRRRWHANWTQKVSRCCCARKERTRSRLRTVGWRRRFSGPTRRRAKRHPSLHPIAVDVLYAVRCPRSACHVRLLYSVYL